MRFGCSLTLFVLSDASPGRTIPRRTRALVWLLLAYLAVPIDIVPDFIPVIGYADDAIITSLVLRHVLRRAGHDKLRWSNTHEVPERPGTQPDTNTQPDQRQHMIKGTGNGSSGGDGT